MSKWQQIQAERQALFWELVRQGTVLIHHRPSPLRSMPSHYRRATLDHGQCYILPGSGYGRDVGLTAAADRLGDRAVDERGHDGHLDQPTAHGEEVLDALAFPSGPWIASSRTCRSPATWLLFSTSEK